MIRPITAATACVAILFAVALYAQRQKPAGPAAPKYRELKSLLCDRGKLLVTESFETEADFKKSWRIGAGSWSFQNGVTRVDERASDNHHPYPGRKVSLKDAIVQFSFRFDGARSIFVGFDRPGAHVCRLVISPTRFRVQRTVGIGPTTKSTLIEEKDFKFQTGRWYTIVLEIQGKQMLAQVENRCFVFGSIDGIEIDKTQFQIMSTGPGAWIDELRIWEATPSKAWPRLRQKLIPLKKKRCK